MGKLALFGALAGAGQAVVKGAELKAKEQAEVRLGDIAEARERRIAEFNSGLRTQEQGVQNEFVAGQATKQQDFQKTMSREEQAAQTDRNTADLQSRESEGAASRKLQASEGSADRANRLDVANIGAGARADAKNKRFTIEKQKRTSPPPLGADGNPVGVGSEYEATVVTINDTGETFEQQNDKFLPQGGSVKKVAGAKNVQRLIEATDPAAVDQFVQIYGYLPAEFFRRAK